MLPKNVVRISSGHVSAYFSLGEGEKAMVIWQFQDNPRTHSRLIFRHEMGKNNGFQGLKKESLEKGVFSGLHNGEGVGYGNPATRRNFQQMESPFKLKLNLLTSPDVRWSKRTTDQFIPHSSPAHFWLSVAQFQKNEQEV